jgi:taurine dioxygenase
LRVLTASKKNKGETMQPTHLRKTTLLDIAKRYKRIRPEPRMPNYAAWIDGIDLTKPIDAATKRELHQALLDFEVLFFRPQVLTPEQHIELASAFGGISPGSYFSRKDGYPQVEIIEFDEQRPPEINIWHSDLTWQKTPPLGTVIQITVMPPAGGNTCWASMSKAYDALSDGMKLYLEGLTATHTWEVSGFRDALAGRGEEALVNAIRTFKPVEHQVVRVHPESGKKCLFVNETFTKNINGVHFRESRSILSFLYDWIKQPEFMVHHQWEQNGLAVWDNRSTQHYALADYWPHRRVNQRVTFETPGTADAKQSPNEVANRGVAKKKAGSSVI